MYAQKNLAGLPDRAELHAGVRVEHIDVGPVNPVPETAAGPDGLDDAGLLERVPAFSGPLRSIWQSERPDVVHALRWTSGLAALAAARDLGIPVVQEFSSLSVTERRDAGLRDLSGRRAEPGAVKADGASAARIRLEPAIGRSASAVVADATPPRSATWPAWACTARRSGSCRGASTPSYSSRRDRWPSATAGRSLTAADLTQRSPSRR